MKDLASPAGLRCSDAATSERLREKKERDARSGIWSFSHERAYPEFDFVRTGELGIQISDQCVGRLRRAWRDGRRQRLEDLIDDIVSGIVTYLVGVKARREERERWEREWQRREQLRALARAREEREVHRSEFLQRLVAISAEADELQSFLLLIPKCDVNDSWPHASRRRLRRLLSMRYELDFTR